MNKVLLMPDQSDTRNRDFEALRIFHDVARAITSSLELDSILRTIMQQMAQFFQPEAWSLLMVDEGRRELYYAIALGKSRDELRDTRIAFGEGVAGWVAEHGETLIVPDLDSDPRFRSMKQEKSSRDQQSVICIPVLSRSKTLAVIQLTNSKLQSLTDYTIYFLHVLCDYTAIAIENASAVGMIRQLTITDDCTGLYNARHLHRMLAGEMLRAQRLGESFSLLFVDLDHFKRVNDTYGHLAGSQLLLEVGGTLKSCLRDFDSAYRYGGDEFVVLFPGTGKTKAIAACRRIFNTIRAMKYLVAEDLNLNVKASFGLATFPEDGTDVESVIRAADDMMYLVKNASRDNIAVAQMGLIGAETPVGETVPV